MLYNKAIKLKPGMGVFDKPTRKHLKVAEIKISAYDVYVRCDDGQWYHHRRLLLI